MTRPAIDLRSDTVTRPTPAMRRAMAEAEVGDDVYGEDPTVLALERRTAELLGKEAALFVPSGTMANQIAVGVHAGPGDELLCDATSHVYVWEGGGIARLWGVTARPSRGTAACCRSATLDGKIRPDDGHYVRTRLVCLENTHNRGGGRVYPIDDVAAIAAWARAHGLAMHLDGARLMNAVVASGIAADEWGAALRHRLHLLLEGPGRARRLGDRGPGRADPQGAPAPQGPRRRDAPGRRSSPRRRFTRSSTTSNGSPTTTRNAQILAGRSRRPRA